MRLRDVGSSWLPLTAHPGRGCVVAAFPRAAYLQVGDRVVALVSDAVARGPLHARAGSLPALGVGEPVEVEAGLVRIGRRAWTVDRTSVWEPPGIDAARLLLTGRADAASLTIADRSALAAEPLGSWPAAGVDALVAALAGRGPGLTPAGDDVLAGVLVVLALTGADRGRLAASVRRAKTHAISHAFLAAAAGGECIEPVHHLLAAVADGCTEDVARWQAVLAGVGGTSGCDLVLGVRTALQNGRSASQMA
jgi:hypothetical protein